MKSKLLLLSFLMLFTTAINYAQTSATSGIAIQGIARDANNTARIDKDITLSFRLYYKDASTNEVLVSSEEKNLKTDAFGVFSHIVAPALTTSPIFASQQVYLRISEGTTVISDQPLNQVPYAIAASNGVPTGSIMPFLGTTAPVGWVLCDGSSLPSNATALIALIGNNAPDLRGMFLRGAGTNGTAGYNTAANAGPALQGMQQDSNLEHTHGAGTLKAVEIDPLIITIPTIFTGSGSDPDGNNGFANHSKRGENIGQRPFETAKHGHDVQGITDAEGGKESRPVNYGVNYIIKL